MNRKAQMMALSKIELSELPMPQPKPDEAVVKIEYCGICGSDVHFFREGRIGKKVIDRPFILGHECSGVVIQLGSQVTGLKVGDRVVLEPGVPCGKCEFCKSGRYNLCPDVHFMASPPYDGALRNYLAYPADMLFVLPENVSSLEGAMIEPLCVGLHAAEQGEVCLGKTVTILGAGCIGMMTLLACKAMGASQIIVSDVFDLRLSKAKELGADFVINAKDVDTVEQVAQITGGVGTDIVFEAAGNPITMAQTSKIVKRGGNIVVTGNVTQPTQYDFLEISVKEATIKTVFRYANLFPLAIRAIASGKIDIMSIQPKIFDFEQTHEAFQYTVEHSQSILKSVIKMD